jgi:hypothetical protein
MRTVGPSRQRANEQQNEEDKHNGSKHSIIHFVIPDPLMAVQEQSFMPADRFHESTRSWCLAFMTKRYA